jgi:hypothetical protein
VKKQCFPFVRADILFDFIRFRQINIHIPRSNFGLASRKEAPFKHLSVSGSRRKPTHMLLLVARGDSPLPKMAPFGDAVTIPLSTYHWEQEGYLI